MSNPKTINCIITLRLRDNKQEDLFYRPTIKGNLIGEILLLALESLTNKKLESGMLFYEVDDSSPEKFKKFSAFIKHLDELTPNINYISEDSSIELKRKINGRFAFKIVGEKIIDSNNKDSFFSSYPPNALFNNVPMDCQTFTNITEAGVPGNNKQAIEGLIPVANATPEDSQKEKNPTKGEESLPVPNVPPPPMIPIPPPPPPPPMMIKKNSINDGKKKMRPLRWSAIPKHQLKLTVWAEEKSPVKSDLIKERELERLFSISPANSPDSRKSGSRLSSKSKTSLLPIKRANNISIVLSRLPSVAEIQAAVFLQSETNLTVDQLNSLKGILPLTEEDISPIREFRGDSISLSKAELFVFQLAKVERLLEKVDCLLFMETFAEYYCEIRGHLDNILAACNEVHKSKKLMQILKVILAIGSILNRDTYLSSSGFRLQSLKHISETKAKQGSLTLVHYLADLIGENSPELLYFEAEELPHCAIATAMSIDNLSAQVKSLSENLAVIENELSCLVGEKENSSVSLNEFIDCLTAFQERAKKQIGELQNDLSELKKKYTEVGAYFGEDPSDVAISTEFFGIIHNFSQSLLVKISLFIS